MLSYVNVRLSYFIVFLSYLKIYLSYVIVSLTYFIVFLNYVIGDTIYLIDVYNMFKAVTRDKMSARDFNTSMERLGFKKVQAHGSMVFRGIKYKSVNPIDSDSD